MSAPRGQCVRTLFQQFLDVGGRDVPLDRVAVDQAGMARGELLIDTRLALDAVEHRGRGVLGFHFEAVRFEMLHPFAAAAACG
ncbi:hypothetical protein [Methyloceanibacter marginalis]|uniref:hypothetical protein n=1 Tax=Methyloceanibacter marginalis TaxID=1774971 RepID=UPI00084BF713